MSKRPKRATTKPSPARPAKGRPVPQAKPRSAPKGKGGPTRAAKSVSASQEMPRPRLKEGESSAAEIARDAQTLAAAKVDHVAHSLLRAARLWNEQAIAAVRARGFSGARLSHTQVLPHLDLEGTRLTDLAARMDVSKQAAQQLINELEEAGIVERIPDPRDGRAKLIRFTAAGRRSILDGLDVLRSIEEELRRHLGDHAVDVLGSGLGKVVAFLEARQKG